MTSKAATIAVSAVSFVCIVALIGTVVWVGAKPGFAILQPAPQEPERTYTADQIATAQSILNKVRAGLAMLDDDGTSLEVRFKSGVLVGMERERLHQLVTSIANADAVLARKARQIDFYAPTGERIAVASPLSGIQLK